MSRRGCALYSDQGRQDCELDRLDSEQEKLDVEQERLYTVQPHCTASSRGSKRAVEVGNEQ